MNKSPLLATALIAAGVPVKAASCRLPVVTEIANPAPRPSSNGPFTIASLNMAEETDHRRILEEFRASAALAQADVVLLQEVLYAPGVDGSLQKLARQLGLHAVFSSSTEPRPDGREDGIAVLSRYPIVDASAFALTSFHLNVRSRCRHALAATIRGPGGKLVQAFNVHLDTRINAANRVEQLRPVVKAAESFRGPAVIGGDMNTNPNYWIDHLIPIPWGQNQHEPLDRLLGEGGFQTPMDGSLATHDMLGMRLDWIYLRGLIGADWGVQPIDFSDHKAVWLRLAD